MRQLTEEVRSRMQDHLLEASKRWLGQRSQKASISACEHLIEQCLQLGIDGPLDIEQRHIDCYVLGMENRALSASTINTRLVAVKAYVDHLIAYCHKQGLPAIATTLSALKFGYKTRKKQAKWHMTDSQRITAMDHLQMDDVCLNDEERKLVWAYIDWTIETGLRVEETLRLLWSDFEGIGTERPALNVPGTKNEHSAVRIPISLEAATIIQQRYTVIAGSSWPGKASRLFDISYRRLHTIWDRLREAMGVADDPTSTLKALRRNFAAGALRKGLPARIIQELMRHSNIETTMGYLRLIGMSDNDETRALLNRQINLGHDAQGRIQAKPHYDAIGGVTADRDEVALVKQLEALGYTVKLS